ncbi:NAD(P)/FAD-dependent oxidoreductase [Mycolicibacterium sp. CH28]|uniref:flavin-containing monooxygenase n=1 Tax=Mycolicibacterium sp. CH28 TaxID=2512237 RepID=UPI001386CC56|nr:NAD(P)/FAD-dependent oxidoreductase [Mycolicibacterium sp. CH28]
MRSTQTADFSGQTDYDAIIIGAGFGGLRAIHGLRDVLGLDVKVFERASDVGGTWFWNRYPGARTDTEGWAYCMYFDEELYSEWAWSERYPSQEEMLRYLNSVADKHDMRRSIEFETTVDSAVWDEQENLWRLTTDAGVEYTAKYFIPAVGILSQLLDLPFGGLDQFEGEWYQASKWPDHEVNFEGKRVAVIGTGATGVQLVPTIAHSASHLTVFQRSPNYVLPARNSTIDAYWSKALRSSRDRFFELCTQQTWGFPLTASTTTFDDVKNQDEIRELLDRAWESGAFHFVFEGFGDSFVNEEAARVTQEYLHQKIRAMVDDPATADLLCPNDHRLGVKRPPAGHYYYESFNRDNVDLVSVKDNPIATLTPGGLRLADGQEFGFDIIIFALGFEAVSGALAAMDVRGRGGVTIQEQWSPHPRSYLGIAVEKFPNMFMPMGPLAAGGNVPLVLEHTNSWIQNAIAHMRDNGIETMEATTEAVDAYLRSCVEAVEPTILWKDGQHVSSWFTRSNVPGAEPSPVLWFAGVGPYVELLSDVAANGYRGFEAHASALADSRT